jgi:SpoVK/Ycf46/Vps4 family AAA+-type ATPase
METTEQLAIDAETSITSSGRNNNSSLTSGGGGAGFSWPLAGIFQNNNNSSADKTNDAASPNDARRKNFKKGAEMANADNYATSRYAHDVEQAKLMRRGMEKRKQQQQHQQPSKHGKEITESDVLLGLHGLDQAESLRKQGRVREALKISELSIELLIQFLKSNPTTVVRNISRDTVGARVQVALTSAEEMKATLKTSFSQHATTNDNDSIVLSLSRSITEAIGKTTFAAVSNSNGATTGQSTHQQQKNQHQKNQQPSGQTTSSPKNKAAGNNQSKCATTNSLNRRQPHLNPYNSTKAASQSATTHALLASSTDPLVQTIQSELYIDPSQLQSTSWDDIAGLDDAKLALQEAAILPLMRPDLFSGLRKPRNILLYGPPGTGKTMLVKAVAHESQCALYVCTSSAMTSKWLGEGEKLLKSLFNLARSKAPSIIFVDEMDALLSRRKSDGEHEASRRFKTEFMTQIDGIVKDSGTGNSAGKHLLVIAATNCPWDIDSAVLRRFPRRIYIPLPDSTTRKHLLLKLLEKAGGHDLKKSDISAIVKRLSGFSGSDMASIASDASFGPIRSLGGLDAIRGAKSSDIRPIQRSDFDNAIDQATKSVSKDLLKKYDTWKQEQAAS